MSIGKVRFLKSLNIAFLCLGFSIISGFKDSSRSSPTEAFKPHMQSLYVSLTKLIAFALVDEDKLTDSQKKTIEAQILNLSQQAEEVRKIAKFSDKSHEFLAQELERNARLSYSNFRQGKISQARFFITDVANTCYSCHTSRQGETDSSFASNFNKGVDISSFDLLARARFFTLSRQFELAEINYEKLLSSHASSIDELVNVDPILEYLIVSIRVRHDIKKSLEFLKSIVSKNYPEVVKNDLRHWIVALEQNKSIQANESSLTVAKDLVSKARELSEFPADRSGMVQYILASKILINHLAKRGVLQSELAETYFELGRCERIIGNKLFADESSSYFENAIRLAPKTDLARKAFSRYEENIVSGYTGSSGTSLPEDERTKLSELRKLAY
ncbi:MAG: hypothetical protein EOO87_01575 [Pedobacter sp.]|nr:MAG: hypothetical protein EOO87_01575 [Pedobacter sp.]